MKIYRMIGEFLGESTYIVGNGSKCLIIDPGVCAERIISFCKEKKCEIAAILLTHAHIDHIYGAAELAKRGYVVYVHKTDASILNGRANLALALGVTMEKIEPYIAFEGDRVSLDIPGFSVEAIFTPGHTAGSVCYYIEGNLFSGDTLFSASYGRTDLPTGDEQDLLCSVCNELFELPDDTKVFAGHSDVAHTSAEECTFDTTIGKERKVNPILELL